MTSAGPKMMSQVSTSEDMMTEPSQDVIDNMQEVMARKAEELFRLCDKEEKGFINKKDMQRLRTELPVSPEQLEVVFDSLDDDGNGFLTLEEFTLGFGSFLGLSKSIGTCDAIMEEDEEEYGQEKNSVTESKLFTDMIHQIGADKVFQDEDVIKAMWMKLHSEEPDLASTFEDFLARLSSDIRRSKVDFHSLESALLSKSNEHEEEVKKLYEEMELQMKQEREQILNREKTKERQIREEMEAQLKDKERQLQEMLSRHQEMEDKLSHLSVREVSTKQENEKLQKEKEELEEMLGQSQDNLEESRMYIQQMQSQQKDEKRERARAALMLSEGIAIERESLVKQLDILKDVNKKLRDDKDEAEATDTRRDQTSEKTQEENENEQTDADGEQQLDSTSDKPNTPPTAPAKRQPITKQGSILSNYFPEKRGPKRSVERLSLDIDVASMLAECEDDDDDVDDTVLKEANVFVPGETRETESLHQCDLLGEHQTSPSHSATLVGEPGGNSVHVEQNKSTRIQPVGADSEQGKTKIPEGRQRIYKVVFVGDSGVGKSSFIYRFCHRQFKAGFSATIGVDFQIKTFTVDGNTVILQLWDTAGQERFRSMTKAYFRKADGVIVMYDVTTEKTFTSVRNWMDSVKEQVEPYTVITLIGNKTDLAEDDAKRPVKEKDGMRLAEDYEAIFYETSSKTGYNVDEAMEGLARLLQVKEDKKLEEGLNLTEIVPKKSCCGR